MTRPTVISTEEERRRVLATIQVLDLSKPWRVTVERDRPRRSRRQDGLYFMWLDEVAKAVSEHTGYEKDEIHEYLKARFLEPKIIQIGDKAVERFSIRDLTTAEMAAYTDKVYRWATSELGLILPLPEEMGRYV